MRDWSGVLVDSQDFGKAESEASERTDAEGASVLARHNRQKDHRPYIINMCDGMDASSANDDTACAQPRASRTRYHTA